MTSDPLGSDATCTLSEEPVVVIGEDESDEKQWFSSVRGAGRMSDGSLVGIDRRSAEVRVYDETGLYLRSMGGMGEGPGEFSDAFHLWILPGDTLWVGDYRPWRYNVFSPVGDFLRSVQMQPMYLDPSLQGGVLDNGYSVNVRRKRVSQPDFKVPDTIVVEVHDPGGGLADTVARIPNEVRGYVRGYARSHLWPLFQASAYVDALGTTVALANGRDPEVRILDDRFNLRLILRWEDSDREVTRSDIRVWREDYVESRTGPGASEWLDYEDALISTARPVAELFPAMSNLMVGRNGRIWVKRYDRPREERGWLAFESDGEFFCHRHLPGVSMTVREFGSDYVLVVGSGELGVQTVEMYWLGAPGR